MPKAQETICTRQVSQTRQRLVSYTHLKLKDPSFYGVAQELVNQKLFHKLEITWSLCY